MITANLRHSTASSGAPTSARRSNALDDLTFWNWATALTYGAAYDPTALITTLSGSVAAAATTAALTSGGSFPTTGGCWLGPNAAGEAWEYATYTGRSGNTLSGLTRETVDSEQSGAHTAGAVAGFWFPLVTNDGSLTLTEEADSALGMVGWQAQIQGVNIPQVALRNGHLVLVQTRYATDTPLIAPGSTSLSGGCKAHRRNRTPARSANGVLRLSAWMASLTVSAPRGCASARRTWRSAAR